MPYFTINETVLNVTLGETFSLSLTASDEDQDSLTFDIVGLPEGANFSSDGNNLYFVWLVNSTKQVIFILHIENRVLENRELYIGWAIVACTDLFI